MADGMSGGQGAGASGSDMEQSGGMEDQHEDETNPMGADEDDEAGAGYGNHATGAADETEGGASEGSDRPQP